MKSLVKKNLHAIALVFKPTRGKEYPICIAGKRNAPPQEKGGILVYEDIVKNHGLFPEEYGIDESFSSEKCDLDAINSKLRDRFSPVNV